MTARVLTGGKVSKARGRSASVAIVEGLGEPVVLAQAGSPGDATPTVAQMRAAALGIGAAVAKGATRVELVTPSKKVAKAINAEPGGGIDDYHGALLAGWAIHWTRDCCADGWSVEVRPAKELPEVDEVAARALKS